MRPSTYDSYRRNIDLHVVPRLGRRPLDKLTPEDVDLFYARLLTEGRKQECGDRGAGLAPKTVRNIHVMLNKAIADAARKGIVPRNVVAWPTRRRSRVGSTAASRRGMPRSCACSSRPSGRTGCTRRSTWPPTPGCAGARCSGFGGATSTSTAAGCRCG